MSDLAALSAPATEPFNWAGLANEYGFLVFTMKSKEATDLLRERIEAAFVPVEWFKKQTEALGKSLDEATARAEAAEARVSELTAQLAEARQAERAAVVAWLRSASNGSETVKYGNLFADEIEAREHLT